MFSGGVSEVVAAKRREASIRLGASAGERSKGAARTSMSALRRTTNVTELSEASGVEEADIPTPTARKMDRRVSVVLAMILDCPEYTQR